MYEEEENEGAVSDKFNFNGEVVHFEYDGRLVNQYGKKPNKTIDSDQGFINWAHKYTQNTLIQMGLIKKKLNDSYIFHTRNALHRPNKLLILMCGSGHILAGLWSARSLRKYGLNAGTVLPMIEEAKKRKMDVLITNPNISTLRPSGHTLSVFKNLIIPANPNSVYLVCHSYAGSLFSEAFQNFKTWFTSGVVKAFAFTAGSDGTSDMKNFAMDHGVNWVVSNEPTDTPVFNDRNTVVPRRSAGVKKHHNTTYFAFRSIWRLFDEHGA